MSGAKTFKRCFSLGMRESDEVTSPSAFSEPEPGVEGAGVAAPSFQSHLRPAALLGPDPDHHLPGVPGPGVPPGATAELVRDVDASVGVSISSD